MALLACQAAGAADLPVAKVLPAEVAAPSPPIDFVFGGRLQSDYNFRGITQSNHDASPQGYVEMQLLDNLFYAGLAYYKVDLPTRPLFENDITAGIRPKLGPLQFDFGVIQYYYPDERRLVGPDGTIYTPANTDFLEYAAKVSYTYQDALTVGANLFYERNYLGTRAPAYYVSGTVKYVLPEGLLGVLPAGFSLSGELGRYTIGTTSATLGRVKLPDYTYGNVGASYTYKNFTLDLRYHDTDLTKTKCFTLTSDPRGIATGSGRSNWCGSAFITTLSVDITASAPGVFAREAAPSPAPTAPPKEAAAGGVAIR